MVRSIKQWCLNLVSGPWLVRRYFSASAMQRIEAAIRQSEARHSGQVCFVVEAGLDPYSLLKGVSPRERALALFSSLRIWDTEANNGVLIYLLLADHDVEIVADRGISRHVAPEVWTAICHEMEQQFRQQAFEHGILLGVEQASLLLQQHFPAGPSEANELPDRPHVL